MDAIFIHYSNGNAVFSINTPVTPVAHRGNKLVFMTLTTTLVLFAGLILLGIVAYALTETNKSLGRLNDTIATAAERSAVAAVTPRSDKQENNNALRLQACERLTLMLERINVPNLLLRLPPASGVSAKEHTATLLLTIRQEFEYNVTQQIYVSDALWSIMVQARDNVSQLIVRAAEGAESGDQLVSRLRLMSSRQPDDAIGVGQAAIRREASLML